MDIPCGGRPLVNLPMSAYVRHWGTIRQETIWEAEDMGRIWAYNYILRWSYYCLTRNP